MPSRVHQATRGSFLPSPGPARQAEGEGASVPAMGQDLCAPPHLSKSTCVMGTVRPCLSQQGRACGHGRRAPVLVEPKLGSRAPGLRQDCSGSENERPGRFRMLCPRSAFLRPLVTLGGRAAGPSGRHGYRAVRHVAGQPGSHLQRRLQVQPLHTSCGSLVWRLQHCHPRVNIEQAQGQALASSLPRWQCMATLHASTAARALSASAWPSGSEAPSCAPSAPPRAAKSKASCTAVTAPDCSVASRRRSSAIAAPTMCSAPATSPPSPRRAAVVPPHTLAHSLSLPARHARLPMSSPASAASLAARECSAPSPHRAALAMRRVRSAAASLPCAADRSRRARPRHRPPGHRESSSDALPLPSSREGATVGSAPARDASSTRPVSTALHSASGISGSSASPAADACPRRFRGGRSTCDQEHRPSLAPLLPPERFEGVVP